MWFLSSSVPHGLSQSSPDISPNQPLDVSEPPREYHCKSKSKTKSTLLCVQEISARLTGLSLLKIVSLQTCFQCLSYLFEVRWKAQTQKIRCLEPCYLQISYVWIVYHDPCIRMKTNFSLMKDEYLLKSVSLTERIKLWNKFKSRVNQHTVKLNFLNKMHRESPPFRIKVKHPKRKSLAVRRQELVCRMMLKLFFERYFISLGSFHWFTELRLLWVFFILNI